MTVTEFSALASGADDGIDEDRPLRRREASDYLLQCHGISRTPKTLAKLAVLGGGPPFRRAGRTPIYKPRTLDQWVASITTPEATTTAAHDAYQEKMRRQV